MHRGAWILAVATIAGSASAEPADPYAERVRQVLRATPLIDGHNDLPWAIREAGGKLIAFDLNADRRMEPPAFHTDLPRLKSGGVGGQFWSVYVPSSVVGANAVTAVLEQIDIVHRMAEVYPRQLELALTAADVARIHKRGRVASLIGVEGGHCIDNSLGVLRRLFAAGARYMTLTHNDNTDWADSATDAPKVGGLSPFGEEVVREMNRLGMMVDLSHVSVEARIDAMRVSEAPVIYSHASAYALTAHPQNVDDTLLAALRADGGLVMVTFVERFVSEDVRTWRARRDAEGTRQNALHPGDSERASRELDAWTTANPGPKATLAEVADHIEHIRRMAGVDHVGLGSDFDGTPTLPLGLEGVETYPALLAELMRRGWTDAEIAKLTGENMLRVMREVERVAARLQKTRRSSEARAR